MIEPRRVGAMLEEYENLLERGMREGRLTDQQLDHLEAVSDAIDKAASGRQFVTEAEFKAWDKQLADALQTVLSKESQPSLPGAEAVRTTETKTPEFDAPFSLTPETAATPPPSAPGLFDAPPKRNLLGDERGELFPPSNQPPPEPPSVLPKYAGNLNLNRIDSSDGVKRTLLDISDSYAGQIDAARRGTITRQATRELADHLGMTVDDLLARRKGQAFNAEEALAAREINVASANELYAKSEGLKAARTAGASQDAIDDAYVALVGSLQRHVAIQTQTAGMTAEAGRALGIFNEPVTGAANLRRVKTALGQEGVGTGTPLGEIDVLLDRAGGRKKLDAIAEAVTRLGPHSPTVAPFMRKALKATTTDKIFELWMNSILSGPVTHTVNTTSNTLTMLSKPLESTATATVEALRATLTGTPRERFFGEAYMQLFGLTKGLRDGVRAGIQSFVTEQSIFGASKQQELFTSSGRGAIPGKTGRAIRIPTRILGAEDEFFKAVVYSMEEHGLAYRQAATEGLTGRARSQRIVRLLADPTPTMQTGAAKDALYRTFNADLVKTAGLMRLRKEIPGARWVVPFLRTPINIVSYGVERTPLKFLQIARDLATGKLKGADLSPEVGKAVMGTAIALGVGSAVADGLMTGGGPSDLAERRTLEATGWQPYSVKIKGQYYQYGRLEPLGVAIGLVADFVEIATVQDREEIPSKVLYAFRQNVTNKTFVKGLADVLNAVTDPDRYGKSWIENAVVSLAMAPLGGSATATVARTFDDTRRDPEGFGDTFKSRLPGLSKSVPPRLNIYGDPLKYTDTPGERAVSPIRRSAARQDPVADTLLRLKVPLNEPSDKLTLPDEQKLSPADILVLRQARGHEVYARLSREIARPGFLRLSELEQADSLRAIKRAATRDVSARARALARRQQPFSLDRLVLQARRPAAQPPPQQ